MSKTDGLSWRTGQVNPMRLTSLSSSSPETSPRRATARIASRARRALARVGRSAARLAPRVPAQQKAIVEFVKAWRAKRFCTRSIKKESKMSALKLAVTMLDVTTLEGADSVGKVQQMCAKAMRPLPEDPSVGPAGVTWAP